MTKTKKLCDEFHVIYPDESERYFKLNAESAPGEGGRFDFDNAEQLDASIRGIMRHQLGIYCDYITMRIGANGEVPNDQRLYAVFDMNKAMRLKLKKPDRKALAVMLLFFEED